MMAQASSLCITPNVSVPPTAPWQYGARCKHTTAMGTRDKMWPSQRGEEGCLLARTAVMQRRSSLAPTTGFCSCSSRDGSTSRFVSPGAALPGSWRLLLAVSRPLCPLCGPRASLSLLVMEPVTLDWGPILTASLTVVTAKRPVPTYSHIKFRGVQFNS